MQHFHPRKTVNHSIYFLFLALSVFVPLAKAQKKLINHITRPDGGFETVILLENVSADTKTASLIPFLENGDRLPLAQVDLGPSTVASFAVLELFGTSSVSHFELETPDVEVSVMYRAISGASSPAHVLSGQVTAKKWRIFQGNWGVVFDGLAIVNKGSAQAEIRIRQIDYAAQILQEEVIFSGLPPQGKGLFVLGSPQGSSFSAIPDSFFEVDSNQELGLTALRGTPPGAALGVLWQNHASPSESKWNPSVGINKFDLFMQYLGSASGGDQSPEHQRVTKAMAKKAITDAATYSISYFRLAIAGYFPEDLDLWIEDPPAFWNLMDEMMADLKASDVKIIPVFYWLLYQFPMITRESIRDMFLNENSQSYRLGTQYITEFIQRYKNQDLIVFYELTNEGNLIADLDMAARNPGEPSIQNITTDDMIVFTKRVANHVRSLDPTRGISSGHSTPRPFAVHLWKQPEFSASGGDYSQDSLEEFRHYLRASHEDLDIVSIHLYNAGTHQRFGVSGRYCAGLLDIIKAETDAMGKTLFVGEYGDGDPYISQNPSAPFATDVLAKTVELRIPYSAPWVWELYLFNLFEPNEFNIEPGYTDQFLGKMQQTNQTLGNPQTSREEPDLTPPQVIITWPLNSATLEKPTQRIFAVASDNGGSISKVDFWVGDQKLFSDTSPPYTMDLSTQNMGTGSVQITATAFDPSGNQGSWTINVTIASP